jgi:hypothetical protein
MAFSTQFIEPWNSSMFSPPSGGLPEATRSAGGESLFDIYLRLPALAQGKSQSKKRCQDLTPLPYE